MSFNLSAWALRNRQLVLYFMLVLSVAGFISYGQLGQSEDPPFTFKAMVIRTVWPGATAEEVARQVSDRIEQKAMETGAYQQVVSYSRPGESTITFVARDDLPPRDVPELWYQLRKKIGDIRHTLPPDIVGPFYNDEFGTTFGNIYALTGDGFDYAVMKDYAERLQLQLQRIPDVGKVELIGVQEEKIWIEISNLKLATLGLPLAAVQQALQEQNSLREAGFFETPAERVRLRVSGQFESLEQIKRFPIRVGDRTLRISDVADVQRGFNDPMAPRMRYMEQDALGLAVAMKPGGDILRLGDRLESEFERLRQTLPLGMELHKVSDQPEAVRDSVGEFVKVLAEAVGVVLLVCFFSLGLRTGFVVALSIPLVLAMTFTVMNYFGIGLHKISLGALVLALGLMVDDAIIAVEMMAIKMEQGYDRLKAASFAWTSTAFPMLTGTLITAAGFLPIATAASSTGEYTRAIFQVVTIALLVSWIAAVVFVPWLGHRLLPDMAALHAKKHGGNPAGHDPYSTRFYQRVRGTVRWCVEHRWLVLILTVALFIASLLAFRLVPQQFFAPSTRLELMVDLTLTEGASLQATEAQARRLEERLRDHPGIDNFVAYIGTGSPRFYLPLDQQLPATRFSQFVIKARSIDDREEVRDWLMDLLDREFPELRARISRLENGPPVGYPIQFRLSGEHVDEVRRLAREVAERVRQNPAVSNVHLNWEEPSKIVYLDIDQERARALGVSTGDVSRFLASQLTGSPVSQFREGDELIEILLRGTPGEREALELLPSLAVPTGDGRGVALEQIATLEYGFEEGVIWRRDRLPTVTVLADIPGDQLPASLVQQILPTLQPVRDELPAGFRFEIGGSVEDATRGQQSIIKGLPLLGLVIMTLLMVQLRSFSRSVMVFLTAPLGIIGVTLFLLVFQQPFGFVAMLGTIALSGMIMRNSVILVDQIEKDIAAGHDRWTATIEATVRRFRPIVLTALAAILAMIPLSRSVFFGPMAVAIMGGLTIATALTLLFLPALYAAWCRVRPPQPPAA